MRMDVKSGEEKIVKSSLMSDLIEPGEEECRMRFYYHFTFEADHPRDNSTSSPKIISAIRLSVRYVLMYKLYIYLVLLRAKSCISQYRDKVLYLNIDLYMIWPLA